jgi:hypothetical protein
MIIRDERLTLRVRAGPMRRKFHMPPGPVGPVFLFDRVFALHLRLAVPIQSSWGAHAPPRALFRALAEQENASRSSWRSNSASRVRREDAGNLLCTHSENLVFASHSVATGAIKSVGQS